MKSIKRICLLVLCISFIYSANAQTEVTYYTTMGTFKTVLTDTLTPRTVDSFVSRVVHKFYDGLIFHRVVAGFVIQGGDPTGTGSGTPGYYTPDEIVSSLTNAQGSIAMANSGANTNGCQFYINLVTNSFLNGHYTVFGMTTSNFTVVQNIGHVAVDTNDRPLTPVVMDSVRITHVHTAAITNTGKGVQAAIFPNPNRGTFTIDLPATITNVEIVDMTGRIAFQTSAKGKLQVDLRNQPVGLYVVRLANTEGTAEGKVIVE